MNLGNISERTGQVETFNMMELPYKSVIIQYENEFLELYRTDEARRLKLLKLEYQFLICLQTNYFLKVKKGALFYSIKVRSTTSQVFFRQRTVIKCSVTSNNTNTLNWSFEYIVKKWIVYYGFTSQHNSFKVNSNGMAKENCICSDCFVIYFPSGFSFTNIFTNHKTAGEGEGPFCNSSLPFPASKTLRH